MRFNESFEVSVRRRSRYVVAVAAVFALLVSVAACGNSVSAGDTHVTLHFGYYGNLTHAPALVGVANGIYQQSLGSNVTLKTQIFNAGPAEVEAMFGGALDAGIIGPSPAINAFVKSHGQLIRIVVGATVGGAGLVVRVGANINSPDDLRGKTIAAPQLGNTQDVALRAYLADHGMHTDPQGGGDVKIVDMANSDIVTAFQANHIDGAWVPEPYVSRLIDEYSGKLLVDESTLWPGGKFVTAFLIVTTAFLHAHPDVVKNLLRGQVAAIDWINSNQDQAKTVCDSEINRITGKPLLANSLNDAWGHLTFTWDPLPTAMQKSAQDAVKVGVANDANIKGIVDLSLLNQVLKELGRPQVSDGGLG